MTPASARPTGTPKLAREDRAEQILDAASLEFGAAGYRAASLAQVADRIGVSKALVLNYFGSKDALYAACAERTGASLVSGIERVITSDAAPLAMAEATLAAIFEALADRPQDWNIILDRSAPPGSDAAEAARSVRRAIAGQASRGIQSLSDLTRLEDADDVAVLTEIWMGAVSSVVNWWVRHPDRSAAEMAERCGRILTALTGQAPVLGTP